MDILEGKNEFVRDANGNEELASRICNYVLDSILVENPDLALRKRLNEGKKERKEFKKVIETIYGILYEDK